MKTNKLLIALIAVAAVAVLGLGITAIVLNGNNQPEFVPPPFAELAQEGVPENLDEKLGYTTIYQPGMVYSTSLCGAPKVEDGGITLYLTNVKTNNVWLKVRVFDSQGNTVAECGLIKPGQYLKSIPLKEGVTLEDGDAITLKMMGYEPQTYYSGGSFTIDTFIGGLPDPNDTAQATPAPTDATVNSTVDPTVDPT